MDVTTSPSAGGARLPAILVALSGAAAAFVGVMLLHASAGINEHEEMRVFMLTCILVPVSGIVYSAVADTVKRRSMPESELFWPLLALANAILWVVIVQRIREALPPPKTGAQVDLVPVFERMLMMWAACNVAVISFVGFSSRTRFAQWLGERMTPWVERALPFIVFAALLPFTMHTPPVPWRVVALLAVTGLASIFHEQLFAFPRTRRARLVFDLLVLVGLYLVVMDPLAELTAARVEHHNYLLGPTAAVRAGKTMLVDVSCQYGVGVVYFLAALMRLKLMAPSIQGFSHVICVFAFCEYAIFYATLRMTTRSAGLSALVSAVAFMVVIFEQSGQLSEYPSTSGLRFLPGFLFVFCIAVKARFPKQTERMVTVEALIVGATSIWSFEAFVYVVAAYLASLVYDAAHARKGEVLLGLRDRIAPMLVATVAWQLWLVGFTRARSGAWPHWSYYFDFIRVYGIRQLGALPIEPWTPWLVIGGLYAVGLTALGYRRLAEETKTYRPELAVVFTMCALGIAQYTYFLGRSHVNNLFHVCLPAFFVAGYIFIRAAKDVQGVSKGARRALVFVGYGASALCVLSAAWETASKLDHTMVGRLARPNYSAVEPYVPARARDSIELIERYLGDKKYVPLFSSPDTDVEVFLLERKASIYPIGYQPEDALVGSAKDRIYELDDHLKIGDIVVADFGSKPQHDDFLQWELAPDVNAIDRRLWHRLEARFGFEVIEKTPSGVAAVRLRQR